MRILTTKKEQTLKKIKSDVELAELIYTGPDQTYDKDMAIRKLNAAIRDIFSIIGI